MTNTRKGATKYVTIIDNELRSPKILYMCCNKLTPNGDNPYDPFDFSSRNHKQARRRDYGTHENHKLLLLSVENQAQM